MGDASRFHSCRDKGGVDIDRSRGIVTGACGRIFHPSSRVLRRKKCMSMLRLTTIITWSLVGGSRKDAQRLFPTICVGATDGKREGGNRQLCDARACGAIVVESTHVFLKVRREHTPACTRTIYVPCATARITTYLISITTNCKTISCRPVSTNRRPLACREQRHCSGGGSAAWALKVLPAYLGLSQTPRDAALS